MTELAPTYPYLEAVPSIGNQMGEGVVEAAVVFATLGIGSNPESMDSALAHSRHGISTPRALGIVAEMGFDSEPFDVNPPTVHSLTSTLGRFSTIHTADELSFALSGSNQFQVTNNGPYGQRMAG